jgi:hypothetical protein
MLTVPAGAPAGWDTSSPTTGLAKSTISVQVPWMGLTAHLSAGRPSLLISDHGDHNSHKYEFDI